MGNSIDQTLSLARNRLNNGSDSIAGSLAGARVDEIALNGTPVISKAYKAATGNTVDSNGLPQKIGAIERGVAGTEAVIEAVAIGFGVRGSIGTPSAKQTSTVTRYMTEGEANAARTSGEIPNVGIDGKPRPTHVTTDAPLDSSGAAAKKYEISPPTHRATVPADRVKDLGPAPDGRSTTSGGGSQAATPNPIPVKPEEIKKLKN